MCSGITSVGQAQLLYLQGRQEVTFELHDPSNLLGLTPTACTTELLRSSTSAAGIKRFTILVDLEPKLARAPFPPAKHQPTFGAEIPAELKAIAESLVQRCQYQHQAVENILGWVADSIGYDAATETIVPQDVLKLRRASCRGLTSIAGALLNAVGISTREVSGYLARSPDAKESGTFHRWLEVFYPGLGWLPSSPGFTTNFVDAFHLPLTLTRLPEPHLGHPVRTLEELGISLTIVSWKNGLLELDSHPNPEHLVMARKLDRIQHASLVMGKVFNAEGEPVTVGEIKVVGRGMQYRTQPNYQGAFAIAGLSEGLYILGWQKLPCPPYEQPVELSGTTVARVTVTVPNVCTP